MHGVQSGGREAGPRTWGFGLELVLRFGKQRAGGARPESQPPPGTAVARADPAWPCRVLVARAGDVLALPYSAEGPGGGRAAWERDVASSPPTMHTPARPGEQGGCCEGPRGDLSPRASRLHAAAQRSFCACWFARGAAWGPLVPGWPWSPGDARRGASSILHACPWHWELWEGGVSTLGTGRGGEDGEEWLQRGSLLVPGG